MCEITQKKTERSLVTSVLEHNINFQDFFLNVFQVLKLTDY